MVANINVFYELQKLQIESQKLLIEYAKRNRDINDIIVPDSLVKVQQDEANLESYFILQNNATPEPEESMLDKLLLKQYAEYIEKNEEEILRDLLARNRTRYCNHCQHYKVLKN